MSVKTKLQSLTVEDYLNGELRGDVRHELVSGHVYAMVGASRYHVLIAGALYAALHNRLRGGPCRAYMADMKVRVGDDLLSRCVGFLRRRWS